MTWLYVPSVSAPASADSTSRSELHREVGFEPFVLWRGKPLPWPRLLRAWKKGGWIRRLSGLTCERSTLERGVERWISWWRVTRASRSPQLASATDTTTHATSGRMSHAPSPTSDPRSSSSKTSALICSVDSTSSPESFKAWATKLRQHCSARRTSARRTDESGFSSSLWPTVVVTDSRSSGNRENTPRAHPGTSLTDAARLWPTPVVADAHVRGGDYRNRPSGGNRTLVHDARLWSTPTVRDEKGFGPTHTKGGRDLATDARAWMVQVPQSWEAPTDARGPIYPTPAASSYGTNRGGAAGRVGPTRLSLEMRASQGLLPGHPDLSTSTAGENTSLPSRSLNPLFVEALCGLPIGWTDCALSETL